MFSTSFQKFAEGSYMNQYKWPYPWNGMSGTPKLNDLLYAIMRDDISKVKNLLNNGWTLDMCDEATFHRLLYYKIGNYQLVKTLTEHHFNDIWFPYNQECIDEEGYCWGMAARAYLLQAYDVMDLLLQNGFSNLYIHSNTRYLDVLLVRKNDMKAILILIQNGFDVNELHRLAIKYNNYQLYDYLTTTVRFGRKTYAIANRKFDPIPKPTLERGSIFSKKRREQEYRLACEDYKDKVQAQVAYFKTLSRADWEQVKKNQEVSELASKVMVELVEKGEI